MASMSKQLESLFKDLSSNLKIENFEAIEDADEFDEQDPENFEAPMGIPIGSIFANFIPQGTRFTVSRGK